MRDRPDRLEIGMVERMAGNVRSSLGTMFVRLGLRLRRRPAKGLEDDPFYLAPMSRAEARVLLDERARRDLGMSGDEFLRRLRAGELSDTSVVHGLAMLAGER